MACRLKVLGFALFILASVAATPAAAAEFQAAESPAAIHATSEGSHVFEAGIVGGISCKEATFTGEEYMVFPTSEWTVTPAYKGCTFLGVSTTVETNGCYYTFRELTGFGPYTAGMDISCPPGKGIVFQALSCLVKIGAQARRLVTTFTNRVKVTIKLVFDVSFSYTSEGICNGLPGTHNDGVYRGEAIATGENEAEETVAVSIE